MKVVDSLRFENCSWCKEIQEKYKIRAEIAEKLNLSEEIIQRFEELSVYSCCPFHRLITADYICQIELGKGFIAVDPEKKIINVDWWTNNHYYSFLISLKSKDVAFIKDNHGYIPRVSDEFFDTVKNYCEEYEYINWEFDYDKILAEVLMCCDLKTLKAINKVIDLQIIEVTEDSDENIKKGMEIIEKLVNECEHSEFAMNEILNEFAIVDSEDIQKAIEITDCNVKQYTSLLQGLIKHKGKKYLKRYRYVALLK